MKNIPKILGTPIWDAATPPPRVWIARLRGPFLLHGIDLDAGTIWHWPLIVDASAQRMDNLTRTALEMLLDEIELPLPDLTESPPQEPPEFLHLMDWRQGNEYILEPHPPRIWRMQIDANDDCVGITWCQGFGLPPEFPRDTRRVTAFHASDEFDTQTILRDE